MAKIFTRRRKGPVGWIGADGVLYLEQMRNEATLEIISIRKGVWTHESNASQLRRNLNDGPFTKKLYHGDRIILKV